MTREELEQVIYERTRYFVEVRVLDCILELIAAEREPATERQVEEAYNLSDAAYFGHYLEAWQSAEQFHGIRKEDGK